MMEYVWDLFLVVFGTGLTASLASTAVIKKNLSDRPFVEKSEITRSFSFSLSLLTCSLVHGTTMVLKMACLGAEL